MLDSKATIKQADLRVLAAEQAEVMAPGCADWALSAGIEPAEIQIRYLLPEAAEQEFLARFNFYSSPGGGEKPDNH